MWAVTDGRAGNRAQALGLAEALARRRPVTIAEVEAVPRRWSAALPAAAWHALRRVPGWPQGGYRGLALPDAEPDLVIGAGRRAAPLVAELGRRTRTVQLLDPRMPEDAFDLLVAPAHDGREGPNVVSTVGSLGRLTPEAISQAAAGWRDRLGDLPRPRVAVLVGGPSGSARFDEDDGARLAAALRRLAEAGWGIMATPSRRTPPAVRDRLARAVPEAFVWDGEGENPYPAVLGLADAVLVTGDSVNMASEAAASGAPVHLFAVGRVAPKLAQFHRTLIEHGAGRPFEGRLEDWSYTPLAEADRVAAIVEERLLGPAG